MTSLNIAVPVAGEGVVYACATERSVGWATDHIRETFNITGGTIYCDEVGADDNELIEEDRTYSFVGGLIQGERQGFSPLHELLFILSFSICSAFASAAVGPCDAPAGKYGFV
jgi:hypothetical protein